MKSYKELLPVRLEGVRDDEIVCPFCTGGDSFLHPFRVSIYRGNHSDSAVRIEFGDEFIGEPKTFPTIKAGQPNSESPVNTDGRPAIVIDFVCELHGAYPMPQLVVWQRDGHTFMNWSKAEKGTVAHYPKFIERFWREDNLND